MAQIMKYFPGSEQYIEVEDSGRKRKRTIRTIVSLCVAAALIFPFETDVVPALQFEVVHDATDSIMTNMVVSERWASYGDELSEHVDEGHTDQRGVVNFPQRSYRSPLALRGIERLINVINYGGNARWGSQAFVTAYVNDAEWGFVHVVPGQPVPPQIVVRRGSKE